MPLSSQMLLLLIVFLVLVAYHARLVEVTSRLDFLWKREAERELTEMRETRTNNRQLLRNILPDHVAHHFLSSSRRHTNDVSITFYASTKTLLGHRTVNQYSQTFYKNYLFLLLEGFQVPIDSRCMSSGHLYSALSKNCLIRTQIYHKTPKVL